MIRLTRLNDRAFVLNGELIKYIEETPDTIITLVNNERILVKESADVVIDRVIAYGRTLRSLPTE
jgi:flagellar protein FlbD